MSVNAINGVKGSNIGTRSAEDTDPKVKILIVSEPDENESIYIPPAPPKLERSGGLRFEIPLMKGWRFQADLKMFSEPNLNDPGNPY